MKERTQKENTAEGRHEVFCNVLFVTIVFSNHGNLSTKINQKIQTPLIYKILRVVKVMYEIIDNNPEQDYRIAGSRGCNVMWNAVHETSRSNVLCSVSGGITSVVF